ncbi:hypothetical protein UA74_27265 [Actinoalloteichus fjordicus]|uniref:Uncharacterized protein n=2 Tax=Actinoalloteichus fjordicus TaxID=1612552 RepID=A0AAC9LHJ1_9PSEU|nr:hypothetical protein UA74_27265 [Actinoalloteichus fjordicus]
MSILGESQCRSHGVSRRIVNELDTQNPLQVRQPVTTDADAARTVPERPYTHHQGVAPPTCAPPAVIHLGTGIPHSEEIRQGSYTPTTATPGDPDIPSSVDCLGWCGR